MVFQKTINMDARNLEFHEIIKGKWSAKGNFVGECNDGTKVHIYEKQMINIGFKVKQEVELPLYCLTYYKSFTNLEGANTNRLTATAIFKSYKELINGLLMDINLNN